MVPIVYPIRTQGKKDHSLELGKHTPPHSFFQTELLKLLFITTHFVQGLHDINITYQCSLFSFSQEVPSCLYVHLHDKEQCETRTQKGLKDKSHYNLLFSPSTSLCPISVCIIPVSFPPLYLRNGGYRDWTKSIYAGKMKDHSETSPFRRRLQYLIIFILLL